jgi:hypothetical protein
MLKWLNGCHYMRQKIHTHFKSTKKLNSQVQFFKSKGAISNDMFTLGFILDLKIFFFFFFLRCFLSLFFPLYFILFYFQDD